MATFGDSFLDMAEAMLGKYNRSHSYEVLSVPEKKSEKYNISYTSNRNLSSDSDESAASYYSNPQHGRHTYIAQGDCQRRNVAVVIPTKRQRITGNYSTDDIVRALNRAMSKTERVEALENAMLTFDHHDRDLHDTEIDAGADVALVKNLVFLQFKAGFRKEMVTFHTEAITREMGSVLKSLECVYRASSDAVGKSFNRVGKDLLRILLALIDDEVKNKEEKKTPSYSDNSLSIREKRGDNKRSIEQNDGPSHRISGRNFVSDLMIRKATKIIGHFARVGNATRPIALFPRFLGSILDLCSIRPYGSIPFEARLSCLWTIANLACNADNMTMMICTPNLINSLITISNRRPDSSDTVESIMEILRAKSIASRTILNLSWSQENKIRMSENPALVRALCQLAVERQAPYKNSKTMQKIMVQTRRHSLASLRNISAAPRRSKIALCNYSNGELLDTLTDVTLNETDQDAVNFSFYAIHNLTIIDTAEAVVNRAALVLALKNVLLKADGDSQGEMHSTKRQCVSATILVLEQAITPDNPSYENFRELLDTINPSYSADCTNGTISLKATAV